MLSYKLNKMWKLVLIYILFIFGFGFTYWKIWLHTPDSFVFNDQYNIHPFSSSEIDSEQNKNLQFYNEKTDSIRKVLNMSIIRLESEKRICDSFHIEFIKINELFQKVRWDSIDRWKRKQVPDSINEKLLYMNMQIDYYNSKGIDDKLILSKYNLEKSRLEVLISKINLRSSEFVLYNLDKFSDTLLLKNLNEADSIYSVLKYNSMPKLEHEISNMEYEIKRMPHRMIGQYLPRVSLIDFLLFSSSNASTVTYGDIIPNSQLSRTLTFIQSIFCIILLAYLAETIIKKHKKD